MRIDIPSEIGYDGIMSKLMSHPRRWGNWHLFRETWVLRYVNPNYDAHFYEIDLERVRSSAGMLDWIMQTRGLIFITSRDLGDLVKALHWIFRPQERMCGGCLASGGLGQTIDPQEILKGLAPDPVLPEGSPLCAWCGTAFAPTRDWQRYCSADCKGTAAHNRLTKSNNRDEAL